jgi:hypothetical protein
VARRSSQFALAATLGLLAGASINCGDAVELPDLCMSDADCVLDCRGTGCCGSDCPCDTARSTRESERIAKERRDRCSDTKIECPAPRADACDWNARYRAVCRAGACVAEEIEGGAAPEFRAPEVPRLIAVEDPRCRGCESHRDACLSYVEWECERGTHCRMQPECDSACCDEVESIEDRREAAPWGLRIAASPPRPATGVLVMAATGTEGRKLGFVEMPSGRAVTTAVPLSEYGPPGVTWIDGTSDFLIVSGKDLERVSFPSLTRQQQVLDVEVYSGLDVAPTGDVALLGLSAHGGMPNLASLRLGQPDAVITPLTWSAAYDAYPRWSVDGKRVALAGRGRAGRVAIVDASTGHVEGSRTKQPFVAPTWHPSGEFLLLWLRDDEKGICEMAVATPDRTRYARLGITSQSRECSPIAVSPDGDHFATWVTNGGAHLELFAFGSSQSERINAYGDPTVLEWIPLQLAALGISEPPPPPPPPEPTPPPEPPKPVVEPPKPKPEPKPEPKPDPQPEAPKSLEVVVATCAAEHPSAETSVTVRLRRDEHGTVTDVDVLSTSTPRALARCIVSTARKLAPTNQQRQSVETRKLEIAPK